MGRLLGILTLLSFGAACGAGVSGPEQQEWEPRPRQLAVHAPSGERVEVGAGQKTVVHFSVLGTRGDALTVSARELPSFAQLDGLVLTLLPGREHAGSYSVQVRVSDGHSEAHASLRIEVTRANEAPGLVTPAFYAPGRDFQCGESTPKSSMVATGARDPEGDALVMELEVRPTPEPFTGEATHASAPTLTPYWSVPLMDLEAGRSYRVRLRVVDAFGASSAWWPEQGGTFVHAVCP